MDVFYTASVRKDLKQLRSYIAHQSYRSRADDYIKRIMRFCDGLANSPLRGTSHAEIQPGLRSVGFERRATILFTVTDTTIYIEGVFYGGQNWKSRFITED